MNDIANPTMKLSNYGSGKNLFPDSGSFIYDGDVEMWKQRNWFRQMAVHNTLTPNNQNLETTQPITKLWKAEFYHL